MLLEGGAVSIGHMDSPHVVMGTLQAIERSLAELQNDYEAAAREWFKAQREIKKTWAEALLASTASSVTEKKAHADICAYEVIGSESEVAFLALKAAIDMLNHRATICMSVLKFQGRA